MYRFLFFVIIAALQLGEVQAAPLTDNNNCTWGNEVIQVGETIWVNDPVLTIAGASRDWRGFRLVCAPIFVSASSANQDKVGGGMEQVGIGLVLSSNSSDFFNEVMGKSISEIK